MLSLETTLRQHSGKRSVFRLFLAQNKCFRPLKKVKNTYFVRMLSLETTFRQHSLICCELQTCPVFLSTKCVLCQCCLNVVSRGGIQTTFTTFVFAIFCRNMCLRNFRHFKKVNLKSAASLNSVFFPNLVFLCIGLSQCCLRNNIHTKDHESVLGGAKLISKNPRRKHFLGQECSVKHNLHHIGC